MSKPITESILSNETRVFLMCCDFRSFSAVAHALGITQSAVSKIIRKFEDSIGFELFIRNSRPLTLTPEAHLLHRQLRGLKGEMTRSLSSLQSKNYIKPILRIGILESLHLNLGVAILKNLLPNLSQVVMLTASANVLIQRLIERKLDLIITNDVSTEPSHVFRRLLFHEPSVLILPKSFEKDPNQNWTWQRLAVCGLPLIRYWNESGAGEINEMFMKTHGLRFPACVLSGIETAAAKAGYNIIVAQSNESYEQEVKIVHSFLAARVCGVIASLAKNTEQYDHYQELLNNDIPIVFYDRICTELKTERVVVDDYAGSFAAVEYMIQTGCKRIFFYGASPHLEITKNRRNGYLDAMKKYKVPVDDSMIKLCDNRERAIAITPDLLESDNRPDGFFAINDETAAGILYACKLVGLKVPDEVSICGFTDGAIAQSTDPKLTTVEQHGEEVGKSAFGILTDKLNGHEGKSTNKIVRTNLVVRGTTK